MPEVAEDFGRILDHLIEYDVADPFSRIDAIVRAIDILGVHPHIGRPVDNDRRELILGDDTRGYLALYHYSVELNTVFVLAIRAQKEDGYPHD